MANEIMAHPSQFSVALAERLDNVKGALPADLNVQRFIQNGVALLNGNETLANFARQHGTAQIQNGMLQAAFLGLDFLNSEAYLVPYGNTLNFTRSYKGSVKLCKKYSVKPIKSIYAKLVRQGDEFEECIIGDNPSINFKPVPFNRAPIVGAFAVCIYTDGTMEYDTMSIEELNISKSKSKMSNTGAWKSFPEEMYRKTILHRLCKHVDLDFDAKQREIYESDTAIETDPKNLAETEIAENANTQEFVMPEMIP